MRRAPLHAADERLGVDEPVLRELHRGEGRARRDAGDALAVDLRADDPGHVRSVADDVVAPARGVGVRDAADAGRAPRVVDLTLQVDQGVVNPAVEDADHDRLAPRVIVRAWGAWIWLMSHCIEESGSPEPEGFGGGGSTGSGGAWAAGGDRSGGDRDALDSRARRDLGRERRLVDVATTTPISG